MLLLWRRVVIVLAAVTVTTTSAFVVNVVGRTSSSSVPTTTTTTTTRKILSVLAVSESSSFSSATTSSSPLDNLSDVGYQVTVQRPLGIVFGENRSPFGGLVVDDVEPGLNGGVAGLRVGDQLIAVDNTYVVGGDFDSVMNLLRGSGGNGNKQSLDLQLYRGSVASLYAIVTNKNGGVVGIKDGEDNDDEQMEEEIIVMDENYEPPIVTAEDYGDQTISVSKVAGEAIKSLGGLFAGGLKSLVTATKPTETIQLEGDDAKTGQKGL